MSELSTETGPEPERNIRASAGPSKTGWFLGLAGLIPFVLISGLLVYGGQETIAFPTVALALSAYSATILAFLGGIRWGLGLRPEPNHRRDLILSVLPPLAGWVLVLVPAPYAFAGFALCFAIQGGWDLISARSGKLPAWFARLRLVLSVVVVLCQIAVFLRLF